MLETCQEVSRASGAAEATCEETFRRLLRRAMLMRRLERQGVRAMWWIGHLRGLRRAHYGERFGTAFEHELYSHASNSPDPMTAAMGRGYLAGLTLTDREPD